MDYVTVRELRAESGKVWDRVEAGEEIVVTRNGKPFALLLHTEPADVEAALRAYRASRLGVVLDRIQAHAKEQGQGRITSQEIEAEIAAVRKQRAAKSTTKSTIKSTTGAHAKPRRR
jgi:prevent-host-death family protein